MPPTWLEPGEGHGMVDDEGNELPVVVELAMPVVAIGKVRVTV